MLKTGQILTGNTFSIKKFSGSGFSERLGSKLIRSSGHPLGPSLFGHILILSYFSQLAQKKILKPLFTQTNSPFDLKKLTTNDCFLVKIFKN